VKAQYISSASHPMKRRSNAKATPVVDEPENGSKTKSPGFVLARKHGNESDGLLSWVLAVEFLVITRSRHSPHILHLLVAVLGFHSLIVECVALFTLLCFVAQY